GKIGEITAGNGLINLLEKEKDIVVKMEAVTSLGILGEKGYEDAKTVLERLISKETNFRIRKYAIKALGKCGDKETIILLKDKFNNEDPSIETKELIANAIGEIGGGTAIKILKSWALNGKMEVRREIIKALGNIASEATVDLLIHIMKDKRENKVIRKYAKASLKNIIQVSKQKHFSLKKRIEMYF
ncbi:MAG: HEAT repeat domain-containing protein, partial [Promethearchaeota archaeon]